MSAAVCFVCILHRPGAAPCIPRTARSRSENARTSPASGLTAMRACRRGDRLGRTWLDRNITSSAQAATELARGPRPGAHECLFDAPLARCGSCSIANADQVTALTQSRINRLAQLYTKESGPGHFPRKVFGRRRLQPVAAKTALAASLPRKTMPPCYRTFIKGANVLLLIASHSSALHVSPRISEIEKPESLKIARTSICTPFTQASNWEGRPCPRRAKCHGRRCRYQARVAAE